MNGGPDLTGLKPWAGLGVPAGDADFVVAGLPFDGGAVYQRGAAAAPGRLRELSAAMPAVDERARVIPATVHDAGDIEVDGPSLEHAWPAATDRLAALPARSRLTVLGGDHTVAVPIIAAEARRHPGLAVLWVDAHPDLCDWSRGSGWSCGCALRRALEVAGLPPSAAVFAGARDFDPDEVEWLAASRSSMQVAAAVAEDPAAAGRAAVAALDGRPVHVSIDIDVLDPAFAPGTQIPSAGGLSTRQLLQFLAPVWAEAEVAGISLVEYNPLLDVSNITGYAALKLIFEAWAALSARARRPG